MTFPHTDNNECLFCSNLKKDDTLCDDCLNKSREVAARVIDIAMINNFFDILEQEHGSKRH